MYNSWYAERIKESAKSGNKVFVYQDYHSPIGMNHTKNYKCESIKDLNLLYPSATVHRRIWNDIMTTDQNILWWGLDWTVSWLEMCYITKGVHSEQLWPHVKDLEYWETALY